MGKGAGGGGSCLFHRRVCPRRYLVYVQFTQISSVDSSITTAARPSEDGKTDWKGGRGGGEGGRGGEGRAGQGARLVGGRVGGVRVEREMGGGCSAVGSVVVVNLYPMRMCLPCGVVLAWLKAANRQQRWTDGEETEGILRECFSALPAWDQWEVMAVVSQFQRQYWDVNYSSSVVSGGTVDRWQFCHRQSISIMAVL